jgi:F-box protein 21
MVVSLDHLPEEILHSILCHLHPCSAAALEQTNHQFKNVTNGPLLWRHYCEIYYKSWDKKHGILQKRAIPASSVDWKALFVWRYHIDRAVTRLLDSILASQTGRIEKFRAVIDYGYDAKDTLLRHSNVESGEDHLARRWVCIIFIVQFPLVVMITVANFTFKVLCASTPNLPSSKHCGSRVGRTQPR